MSNNLKKILLGPAFTLASIGIFCAAVFYKDSQFMEAYKQPKSQTFNDIGVREYQALMFLKQSSVCVTKASSTIPPVKSWSDWAIVGKTNTGKYFQEQEIKLSIEFLNTHAHFKVDEGNSLNNHGLVEREKTGRPPYRIDLYPNIFATDNPLARVDDLRLCPEGFLHGSNTWHIKYDRDFSLTIHHNPLK